jgi:hypothetical protein
MPKSSPFSIEVTPEERAFLEATAQKYTLPYRAMWVRSRIILLSAEGFADRGDRQAARVAIPWPMGRPGMIR